MKSEKTLTSGGRGPLSEILLTIHADTGDVNIAGFNKLHQKAIIIPALLFGFIIWAAQFASDQILITTGVVSMRSTLFPIMAFIVTPILLVVAGIASEVIWKEEQSTGWTLWIPYTAGFLGMSLAFFLFRVVSSLNQYLPYMAPGILPRLIYMSGDFILYFPVLIVVSTLFAFLSLAGGWGMHWKLAHEEKRPD